MPRMPVLVSHALKPDELLTSGDAEVREVRPGEVMAAKLILDKELYVGETYNITIPATKETRAAAETIQVPKPGDTKELVVQVMPERASGDIQLRWTLASVGMGHWADELPMPEGFTYTAYMQPLCGGAGCPKGYYAPRQVLQHRLLDELLFDSREHFEVRRVRGRRGSEEVSFGSLEIYGIVLAGNVRLELWHQPSPGHAGTQMLHCWFHTAFIDKVRCAASARRGALPSSTRAR